MADFEIEEVNNTYFDANKPLSIRVDKKNLRKIIENLGYAVDSEGYLVVKETNVRLTSYDDRNPYIKIDEVGAIMPHNPPHVFIKNNIGSLALYLATTEKG